VSIALIKKQILSKVACLGRSEIPKVEELGIYYNLIVSYAKLHGVPT